MPADAKAAAFLAWRAESQAETFAHEAFGSTWDLPVAMPANLWFWYRHLNAEGRAIIEANDDELAQLIDWVIPADVLAEWLALGVSIDEVLREAATLALRYLFNPPGPKAPAGKAAKRTATSATTSSSSGRSSRPTSKPRTASSRSKKKR